MSKYKYNLKWEGPKDVRNFKFKAPQVDHSIRSVDLRPSFPACYDQKQLGSCVDNACAGYVEYLQGFLNLPVKFMPSRLYLYYYARKIMGAEYLMSDSGSTVQNGVQSMQHGFCSEKAWPYSDDPIRFRIQPPFWCDSSAKQHTIPGTQYEQVAQTLDDFRAALQAKLPVLIGFSVYDSFESDAVAKTGIMPMPGPNESLLGGHCVLVVGYDDDKEMFIVRNSWSPSWGDKGYFYMPYAFLMNSSYANDFWLVRQIT